MLHVTLNLGSWIDGSAGTANKTSKLRLRPTVRLSYLKIVISTSSVKLFRLRRTTATRVEYGRIEYGGLPVNVAVFI